VSGAGEIVFWFTAVLAVLSAVATVAMRSAIRSAIGLLFHIISLAGMYLLLHAQLLAAVQLIVYAGAVVVLFVFVIMLIGPSTDDGANSRGLLVRTAAGGLMALVMGALAFSLIDFAPAMLEGVRPCPPGSGAECGQFGGVNALGGVLYGSAALPFELVSVLLLVAVLGAIAVARGRSSEELATLKAKKLARAGAK
jgi:NADH-quinone oxidoreductase subunit J